MNDDTQKELVDDHAAKLLELETKWKRALADYQNLEKRTAQQRAQVVAMATIGLIEKLLPIIDNLRRATEHLQDSGLTMILDQFDQLLKDEEVVEIEADGKVFDPHEMECVEQVKGPTNRVVRVRERGYRLGDFILRPAKVEVGHTEEKPDRKDTKKEDSNE